MRVILASASPRRQELLRLIVESFEVVPAHIPEEVFPHLLDPAAIASFLATEKARAVAACYGAEAVVIGADTVVAIDGWVLGKPHTPAEALEMLDRLQGRTHEVITGLAVMPGQAGGKREPVIVEAVVTEVTFRPAEREELERYVATGEPFDKAGAYAIQGRGCVFIAGIRGCFFNVVGLPVFRLAQILRTFGVRGF
jgi:septum formation protein